MLQENCLHFFLKKHNINITPYYLQGTRIPLGQLVTYKNIQIVFAYDDQKNTLNIIKLDSTATAARHSLKSALAVAAHFVEWLVLNVQDICTVTTLVTHHLRADSKAPKEKDHAAFYMQKLGCKSLGYDEHTGGEILMLDANEYRKRKATSK